MTFTRVCKRVVYSLIPAVVLFGTLEGVCRIWEHYDEPPGILAGKKEKLPPKLEGEFRVLFFGGSTVFGSPEPSVGIVAQLEYALKKVNPERTIRFFNYARPGNASSGVVREMSEVVKESDADVMVVLTAHNEYMERTDVTEEDLARLAAIREQMYRSALVRRAQRLYFRYYLARRPDVIEGENFDSVDRNSPRFTERVEIYRRNIDTIAAIARRERIPLIMMTGPSNIADWPPGGARASPYQNDSGYIAARAEADRLLQAREWEKAFLFSENALRTYADDALLLFAKGQALLNLGRLEEAKEALYLARDLDPFPFRAFRIFNDKVRELAGVPGVYVIDLVKHLDARSPRGVTGNEFFVDICHPSPKAAYLIATAVLDAMKEARVVEFAGRAEELVTFEEFFNDEGRQADWVQYRLDNARTAMRPPFMNFPAATLHLEEALRLDPDNWEVLANAATLLMLDGKKEEGWKMMETAAERKGSPIDLNDREAVPYLKEALLKAGYDLEELR